MNPEITALQECRFPSGWFCLGRSTDFESGILYNLDCFDTKLVAFRTSTGKLSVLDGYCPHMGAELAEGTLEDDCVRCPFHHWKWGSQGQCAEIPYAKKIPDKARTRVWFVREINALAFVWHDFAGREPYFEIPYIGFDIGQNWSHWHLQETVIHTHCRELLDNVADKAHFAPIHSAPLFDYGNEFSGYTAVQKTVSKTEQLRENGLLEMVSTYYGPAYQLAESIGDLNGLPVHAWLLNCHLPLTHNSFILRCGVTVKYHQQRSVTDNENIAEQYAGRLMDAFAGDVHIWKHKRYECNPILCDGDGPIHQLRKWYAQFYLTEEEKARYGIDFREAVHPTANTSEIQAHR